MGCQQREGVSYFRQDKLSHFRFCFCLWGQVGISFIGLCRNRPQHRAFSRWLSLTRGKLTLQTLPSIPSMSLNVSHWWNRASVWRKRQTLFQGQQGQSPHPQGNRRHPSSTPNGRRLTRQVPTRGCTGRTLAPCTAQCVTSLTHTPPHPRPHPAYTGTPDAPAAPAQSRAVSPPDT